MPSPRHRRLPSTTFILYLYLKSPLHSSTITPAPLAIQHCFVLSTPPHRYYYYYHVDNSNAAPSNYVTIIATHYYRCRWLITNISMIISTSTSTLLCHSVCYQNVKLLPCQNDFIYNCLENRHHYLTFFLSTAYTYSNHHNDPPKKSHFIRYLYFTAKKKHTLHTLNVERISNEWRAPFVLLAINLHWDWGVRRNKPCAPGFNVTSTSHMKIIKSMYTTPLFSHCTAPTRCCVGLRDE